MSIHINAKKGDIAETVYLPGDPLRAEWIAEEFLKDVVCYNTVRNMFGFTGTTSSGKRVSVQGSGMGMPSLSIYVNELIDSYDVKRIVRVGSAGALQKEIECRSVLLAMGSCSDSAMNIGRFPVGTTFAPIADWELLLKAYEVAKKNGVNVIVGNNFATDKFYNSDAWKIFAQYGVISIEMETAELYTLAFQKRIKALSILTVSDNLVTGESLDARERETTFIEMLEVAFGL